MLKTGFQVGLKTALIFLNVFFKRLIHENIEYINNNQKNQLTKVFIKIKFKKQLLF